MKDDLHFTYTKPDAASLHQGDILKRTQALDNVLKKFHPHYSQRLNSHFQVLTQGCDLVLRGNRGCSARYITIAAVRPLEEIIKREVDQLIANNKAVSVDEHPYCSETSKRRLQQIIESILNNQSKDFFFLHEEPVHGIEEHSCTFLQLNIPIKSEFHYQTCLNAKILQLSENFQSRLGWMVGNLYSRVGTQDFRPSNEAIEEILSSHFSCVTSEQMTYLKKISGNNLTIDQLTAQFEASQEDKRQTQITNSIKRIITHIEKIQTLTAEQKASLKNSISGDTMLTSKFSTTKK